MPLQPKWNNKKQTDLPPEMAGELIKMHNSDSRKGRILGESHYGRLCSGSQHRQPEHRYSQGDERPVLLTFMGQNIRESFTA